MTSLISIYAGGILTLIMAVFHTRFYKLFKWEKEYEKISTLNRKIFHTIHLALLLLFIAIGLITLIYAKELSNCNGISFGLCIAISLFWLWRTVWQIYYFKGKAMHYVLIVFFSLLFISYLLPVVLKFA